ncbi:MAG: hypothetical protein IH987_04210 [Planctomycetes bacterium]|nr:hypothetical protein [Planctomycetota bacterium]
MNALMKISTSAKLTTVLMFPGSTSAWRRQMRDGGAGHGGNVLLTLKGL